jgi:hypothetical protein
MGQFTLLIAGARFLEITRVQNLVVVEALKHITLRALYDPCYAFNGFFIDYGSYACGPEFVGEIRSHDQLDTSEDPFRLIVSGNDRAVSERVSLYIHGYVIEKAFCDQLLYDLRATPVCVELYRVAYLLYPLAEHDQVSVNAWFSPRYDDPVQKASSATEKIIGHLLVYECIWRASWIDQVGIVAVRATEVAALKKEDATHLSRVVDEGSFLQANSQHGDSYL